MYQDEELHEKLMTAFREYFKANQKWLAKGTRRAAMDTRYWLAQIRIIARERRMHIAAWRTELDKNKALKKAQEKGSKDED